MPEAVTENLAPPSERVVNVQPAPLLSTANLSPSDSIVHQQNLQRLVELADRNEGIPAMRTLSAGLRQAGSNDPSLESTTTPMAERLERLSDLIDASLAAARRGTLSPDEARQLDVLLDRVDKFAKKLIEQGVDVKNPLGLIELKKLLVPFDGYEPLRADARHEMGDTGIHISELLRSHNLATGHIAERLRAIEADAAHGNEKAQDIFAFLVELGAAIAEEKKHDRENESEPEEVREDRAVRNACAAHIELLPKYAAQLADNRFQTYEDVLAEIATLILRAQSDAAAVHPSLPSAVPAVDSGPVIIPSSAPTASAGSTKVDLNLTGTNAA